MAGGFLDFAKGFGEFFIAGGCVCQGTRLLGQCGQLVRTFLTGFTQAAQRVQLADGAGLAQGFDLLFAGTQLRLTARGLLLQVFERFARQPDLALQVGLLGIALELLAFEGNLQELVLELEFVLAGFSDRVETFAQNSFLIRGQGRELLREVLLRCQAGVTGLLETQVALVFIEVDDALAVLEDARLCIHQALQTLELAVDTRHGRGCDGRGGGAVVQALSGRGCSCFRVARIGAFADVIKAFGDRIGQERHVPQLDIVLIGLLDDRVAFVQRRFEACAVLFRKWIEPLAPR